MDNNDKPEELAALKFRQDYILPAIYDGDYKLSLEDAFLAGVKWMEGQAIKTRVFVLSGGPQDLSLLYLSSMEQVAEMIDGDLDNVTDVEIEEIEYTIGVKLMTQEEFDNLPEYEF